MNCPPADHSAFKLSVHVVDVGVGHMHGGVILLPPKHVEVATVPDTQSRQHMVLEEAMVPTAIEVVRAFQRLEEQSENHVCPTYICVFRTLWILNGYNLNGLLKRAQNSDSKTHVKK